MVSVDQALSALRGAILNARIYPPGSLIIQQPVHSAFEALSACLQENPSFKVCDLQDRLMLNDDTELHFKAFLQEFKNHDVQIMTLSAGLTKEEVALLAEGFAKNKKDPEMAEGLPAWLSKRGVQHAELSRAHYVAVREGEEVARQVKTLFGQENYEMTAAIVARLEQSLRDLDGLPEDAIRRRKAEIVADLTHRSVDELQALVESDLPDEFFKAGFSQTLLESLSLEKSEQLFNEIIGWAGSITPQDQASELTKIKIMRLRRFLQTLIENPGTRLIPTAMLERLAQLQLVDVAPAGFLAGTESFSVVAYVEHLLSLPRRSVLKAYVQVRLAPVVESLCALQANDILRKLLERVISNLSDEDSSIRATAVKALLIIGTKIHSSERRMVLMAITQALSALAEVEGDILIYEEIALSLARNALIALIENRFDEAVAILEQLARHRTEGHPQLQARKSVASKALSTFAGESLGIVSMLLQSSLPASKEQGFRILRLLGDEAAPFFIEAAKRPGNVFVGKVSVALLRQMGPAIRGKILENIHVGMPADVLLRLLPAIDAQNDPAILQKGLKLLDHPDGSVRIQALAWVVIAEGSAEADEALIRMMEDPDSAVQLIAARQIGEHNKRTLVSGLLSKLANASPDVQEQILLTLARWKVAAALPIMEALLLGPRKVFFRKPSSATASVRARCAWALGQFLPDSAVEAVLRKALSDKDSLVQRNVQTALQHTGV